MSEEDRKPMKKQGKPPLLAKWDRYEQDNLELARLFLADPVRYAGIQVEWARVFMANRGWLLDVIERSEA